uniref:Secreted protein n=1 Tax=Streptomyces avermitilis TaxID=33903 RepID=A0A499W5Z9_STRAX|nr:hypothetical protein SAVMC3_81850 [Streptomyces avermitilis]
MSRRRATVLAVAVSAALLPVSAAGAATGSAATSGTADRATTDAFGRIADAVLTDRTAALLDRQQLKSTAAKIKGGVRLSSALTKTEGTALSALRGRQSRLAALGRRTPPPTPGSASTRPASRAHAPRSRSPRPRS